MAYDYSYALDGDLEEILENFFYVLEDIFYTLGAGTIIAIVVIPALIILAFAIAAYIIKSHSVSGLAKKFGKKNGALAWIPVCHDIFCTNVISEMTEKTVFSIHPKIDKVFNLHDRKKAFYVYLGCALLLPMAASGISYIASLMFSLIPVIGLIISAAIGFVLGLIPTVAIAAFKYAYLRDVLDALKRDKEDNKKMALIITIANHFVPLVEPIYLLTLKKYTPLAPYEYCDPWYYGNPYQGADPYAAPGFNPYGAPPTPPYGNPAAPPFNAPYGNPADASQNNQGNPPYTAPNQPPYGAAPNAPYGQNPYSAQTPPPFNGQMNAPYGYPPPPPPSYGAPGFNPCPNPGNTPYGTPGSAPYGAPGNPPYGAPFNTPPAPEAPEAPATNEPPAPEAATPPTPPENPQSV